MPNGMSSTDRFHLSLSSRVKCNACAISRNRRKVKDCNDEGESVDTATHRGTPTMATTSTRSNNDAANRRYSTQEAEEDDGGSNNRRKRKKRRKTQRSKQLQLQQSSQLELTPSQQQQSHVATLTFASSSNEMVETVGECSKRDSSSSLGGGSRHNTLRESLLTVLGKLVIWRGTRYHSATSATASSSSAPPNSPPATECIGRSTSFFSSGEFS